MNASEDGRIVVAAYGDGTIRWHRADDGRELLGLADPSEQERSGQMGLGGVDARRLLRGDSRRSGRAEMGRQSRPGQGRDDASSLGDRQATSARCFAARPRALETARALGIAEITAARLDVQARPAAPSRRAGCCMCSRSASTSSATRREASSRLCRRGRTRRRDRASRSQKVGPGKASLYADVKLTFCRTRRPTAPPFSTRSTPWRKAWPRAIRIRTSRSFWFRATAR